MHPTDHTFLDPSPDAIEAALAHAVTQANYRAQKGKLAPDPAAYSACARDLAATPEGVRIWVGGLDRPEDVRPDTLATLAGAAWWTDHLGHKHVRVVGRRLERHNELHAKSFGPRGEVRPPAWLVRPDRLVFRALPGRPRELLAVCGCGTIGPPDRLAWTGECCGPCHDRQQEGGQPPAGPPLTLAGHLDAVSGVGFDSSGKTVISSGFGSGESYVSGQVVFWDAAAARPRKTVAHDYHMGGGSRLPFACNGRLVAADGHDQLLVFEARSGKQLQTAGGHRTDEAALSPDGEWLALRGLGGLYVGRRDPGPFDPAEVAGVAYDGTGLAFTADGAAVVAGVGNEFRRIDVQTRQASRVARFPGRQAEAVAPSPDGRLLLLAAGPPRGLEGRAAEGTSAVWLWDLQAGKKVAELPEHRREVWALAFSPDGRFAVAAGGDRALRFWDVTAAAPAGDLDWHVGAVRALAFSPDGEWLASASADGLVRLWPWRQLLGA